MANEGYELAEYYIKKERKNRELMEACWWAIRLFYHAVAWWAIYQMVKQ